MPIYLNIDDVSPIVQYIDPALILTLPLTVTLTLYRPIDVSFSQFRILALAEVQMYRAPSIAVYLSVVNSSV